MISRRFWHRRGSRTERKSVRDELGLGRTDGRTTGRRRQSLSAVGILRQREKNDDEETAAELGERRRDGERERALSKKKISSSEATFQSVLRKVAAAAAAASYSVRQAADRQTNIGYGYCWAGLTSSSVLSCLRINAHLAFAFCPLVPPPPFLLHPARAAPTQHSQ